MDEHCTVYFSQSAWPFNEADLSVILQRSRQCNLVAGISGALLYVQGSIIQVLEGEAEAVETLFNRIQLDTRHTNVRRVMNRPITQRLFPQWTMGYETVTSRQMKEIRGTVLLDEHHKALVTIKPDELIIQRLVKAFYDTNYYN